MEAEKKQEITPKYPSSQIIPPLKLYNSLSKKKEVFEALNPPSVGMYVCGPTVYNNPHIGNARPAVFFDVVRRYLKFLGYKVRYVRNITDVGHLLGDTNDGEDRISRQAKLERLEPMEIVNTYTNKYHEVIDILNVERPSIEPTATGHILEQIETVEKILEAGLAYESEGSIYFDVQKYNENESYGELSGRVLEDLFANTRTLEGQEEKKHPADFALWKKAKPEHLMRWNSPWGEGFPGWHLECTVMSTKYLGETFDIHGGGMDLQFPHHECEIAQAKAANKKSPVRYWLHNNMITIDRQKMSKSLGNFITLDELYAGTHEILEQAYSPMTIRFFILQAHYRGILDFSNKALQDAQKGYKKIINGWRILKKMQYPENIENPQINTKLEKQMQGFVANAFRGMNDDFNTALALGQIFNILKKINNFYNKPEEIIKVSKETFEQTKQTYLIFIEEILALKEEKTVNQELLIEGMLALYKEAKELKDYEKVDKIREYFKNNKLIIKDLKHTIDWAYEE